MRSSDEGNYSAKEFHRVLYVEPNTTASWLLDSEFYYHLTTRWNLIVQSGGWGPIQLYSSYNRWALLYWSEMRFCPYLRPPLLLMTVPCAGLNYNASLEITIADGSVCLAEVFLVVSYQFCSLETSCEQVSCLGFAPIQLLGGDFPSALLGIFCGWFYGWRCDRVRYMVLLSCLSVRYIPGTE